MGSSPSQPAGPTGPAGRRRFRPLRALRSLRLTAVLITVGAVYAAVASFTPLAFRSPWFLAIVGLFALNLAACTSHRLAYHPHRHVRDYMPDAIHVGLLVLLLGGVGSLLARHEQALSLSQGDQFSLGARYTFTLQETGKTEDNWYSRFRVTDGEAGTAEERETRVNQPFRVAGYTVYQTGWEEVPVLTLVYEDGRAYTMAENEGFQVGSDTFVFERTDDRFTLVWYQDDTEVARRAVERGQSFGGLTVTGVQRLPRTVVTLVRDPGAPVALIGALLMSVALVWYMIDRAFRSDNGATTDDEDGGRQ